MDGWPEEVIGHDQLVRVHGGGMVPYAYLDNAASTPCLRAAADAVESFLPWYSSVHRGTGYKSQVATAAYEHAREVVRDFVGAGPDQAVVFTKSATEGLNRIARLVAETSTTVFTTEMERHANMLTWRSSTPAIRYVHADDDGVIDEDDLERQLRTVRGPRLVAVAGAYNVTGYLPPIHRLAAIAHRQGAQMLVDGAQLVPHRRVTVSGERPDERIDYLVFSAHKLYAPFGAGVLVAPRAGLGHAEPYLVGGGIVDLVTLDEVIWTGLPDREEAGSPNVVGAVALAAAMTRLQALGRPALEAQEIALTAYLLEGLCSVPGLRLLAPGLGLRRVGVVSFDLPGVEHSLVAAYLAHEHGIGVRNGCFCAHPGVVRLLGVRAGELERARSLLRQGVHGGIPGAVRVSLGLENTRLEVDRLVRALCVLVERGPAASYRLDLTTGEHLPVVASAPAAQLAADIIDPTTAGHRIGS